MLLRLLLGKIQAYSDSLPLSSSFPSPLPLFSSLEQSGDPDPGSVEQSGDPDPGSVEQSGDPDLGSVEQSGDLDPGSVFP